MTDQHLLDVLRSRGFVQDVTDEDGVRAALDTGPVTFYVGFDPTASSLHIGNLVAVMAMAWLQRSGHRPIAVAGGGTGRIGDPSGRDDERELLDDEAIEANLAGIRADLSKILDLSSPERGLLVDNHDWLGSLGFIEFLRDVGKHFSVNAMIARESVKRRLAERDQGISFTEFSYQLLQAYDFAHLHEAEGCVLQIGGSDQWGNITAGVELTRRLHGGRTFGIVTPLVERSDGRKFSKSTGTAIWLDPDETSPYSYYQWFLNVPDADVGRFLRLYTFLPLDEIAELEDSLADDPGARVAHRALATEATRIVHGEVGLAEAERATEILFGDAPFADLDARTLRDAFDAAPSTTLERSRLGSGIGVVDLLADIDAASSKSEARRLVSQGAVRVNNRRIDDVDTVVGSDDLIGDGVVVIRVGKKRYYLATFA
ncbi:MAG: tyrosine--tRNA ligase [Acidimicrobiia bacterium]|nr:tyrosine--tRNA ligase [Acidimicrobiia bacterium]